MKFHFLLNLHHYDEIFSRVSNHLLTVHYLTRDVKAETGPVIFLELSGIFTRMQLKRYRNLLLFVPSL